MGVDVREQDSHGSYNVTRFGVLLMLGWGDWEAWADGYYVYSISLIGFGSGEGLIVEYSWVLWFYSTYAYVP